MADKQNASTHKQSAGRADLRRLLEKQHQIFVDNAKIKNILDVIPDAVVVLNENRQTVFANETMLKLQDKTSPEDLQGLRPGNLLNCIHANEGCCGQTNFCKYCTANQNIIAPPNKDVTTFDCPITDADMEMRYYRIWSKNLYIHNTVFMLFVIRDISANIHKQEREQMFFDNLKNTFSTLEAMVNQIEKSSKNSSLVKHINTIFSSLNNQIGEFLQLVDLENGELQPHFSELDSSTILKEATGFYEHNVLSENRLFIIPENSERVNFVSDGKLVRKSLLNVIKNALEASTPGDIITLRAFQEDDHVVFSIHNSQYIPREIQQYLFKPSFSTKGMGRGYGTYMVKLITEKYLFGHVMFQSTPRFGTTFNISYPLKPPMSYCI